MKIAYFNIDFPPTIGGGAEFAGNLALNVSKLPDVEAVSVIALNNPQPRQMIDGRLFIWAYGRNFLPLTICRLFFAFWQLRHYDVFHATDLFPVGFLLVLFNKIFAKKKVFVSAYGTDALKTGGFFLTYKLKSWTLSNASGVIAVSRRVADMIAEKYHLPKSHFFVVYPGVSFAKQDLDYDIHIRKIYGIKENDFVVLGVGRLIQRKGFDDVIRALSLINDESVKLLLVGEGEELNELKKMVNDLKLSRRVFFSGKVDTPIPYYLASDIFVMPAKYLLQTGDVEGLGIVFLEAQFFGLPVIGTRSGGIVEAIKENETGFLVAENSPEIISQKILELKNNLEIYEQFSCSAKKLVAEKFSWGDNAQQALKIYSQKI